MQLLDADGKVIATNPITFVAPRVDDATQTVLVKSLLRQRAAGDARPAVRPGARSSGAPTGADGARHAVARISGQYFCFVAEPGRKAAWSRGRARSQVGEVLGNDYVVRSGLKAGDRLIVSGIQKIGDGAPVQSPSSACSSTPSSAGRSSRRSARSSSSSPARVAIPTMPVAQYPALAPPQVTVTAVYTGANAQEVETAVTTPLEQAINGVEGMLYMTSSSTNSGVATITVTFDVTRDQDLAAGRRAEPRVNQALGRLPAEVRTHRRHRPEAGDRLRHGGRRLLGERRVRLALPEQLPRRLRQGRAQARARRRRRHRSSASASTRCGSGSIRTGWPRAS